jgi:hypothetical protein
LAPDLWRSRQTPELQQKRWQRIVSGEANQLDSLQFFWLECNVEIAIIVSCIVLVVSFVTGITIFIVNRLNSRT